MIQSLEIYYSDKFVGPSFVFEELNEHSSELIRKSKLNKEQIALILIVLLSKLKLIPTETFVHKIKEAIEIIKHIDPDDDIFIACALANPGSVIWSDDKRLKNQSRIKILNTSEMARFLG